MSGDRSPSILAIEPADVTAVLDLKWDLFSPWYATRERCDEYTLGAVDWLSSVKLVCQDGVLVGFFLFGHSSLFEALRVEALAPCEDLTSYRERRGIQAVTLGIASAFQGRGLGSLLKDYLEGLDVDFWWGLAYRSLGNLGHWSKRSRIVAENDELVMLLWEKPPDAAQSLSATRLLTATP